MRVSRSARRQPTARRATLPVRLSLERLEERALPALVAAFDFGEASGTTVLDSSGAGNNGTISGATRTAGGKFGGALSFNGTSSWVTVADATSLHLTTGMTVEAWVMPTAASTDWTAAVLKERGTAGLAYGLYATDGAGKPPAGYINRNGTDVEAAGTSVLPLNVWSYLTVTYDGATIRLYVNGAQVATKAQTGSISSSTAPLRIGGDSIWGEYFKGLIDEVRVYNVARTAAQVQADMNTPITPADATPPTATLTAPADGSTVSGTAVTVTANAADNVAVARVQFLLDGANLGAPVTAAPYQISWDSTAATNGSHTLAAKATDAAGNSTTSAAVTVAVNNPDTAPPVVGITAPAAGAVLNGTATLTAAATDNRAVAGVQFQIDGADLGQPVTAAPYTISWDTTTAPSGPHTITAIATDTSNNTASASVTVTVNQNTDTVPPTVAVTAPANNSSWAGTLTLAASAGDNVGVASVQFKVDGANVGGPVTAAPYQVTWDSSKLADGTHTVTATATDTGGNTATSSVSVKIVNGGVFGPVINTPANPVTGDPVVPMNMVLLDNGKILFWDGGPDCLGAISPTVWDPVAGTFTAVPLENQTELRDIFCSAQTVLADGRVLVAGGHECTNPSYIGTAIANVFDPATNQWTFLPDLHDRRWYPTATTLPDGRALVTAGSATSTIDYDPIPEVYDPVANTWTKLTGANRVIPNYPFVFVLPDGNVLAAGSDEAKMATYKLNVATQTWSVVDPTVLDAGSAVMYLPGKILKAGASYLSAPADNGGNTPSAPTAYVLDTTQPNPAWQQTASMANSRTHLNLTILPDDTVLATGGSTDIGGVNPAHAVYQAELWSPVTQTWTGMASEQVPRLYHSTALLLPDGRVAVAGGGHNYYNNIAYPNAEIYSPPYLFKGARPTVASAPSTLDYGSSFFVGTPDGASITSVALIRNGAVTHSFNMDQRYVPLTFTQTAGGLTVQAPADANLAPPGYYMLFLVNANGVPAVAPFVRLPAPYEDSTPPTAPPSLSAAGAVGTATLSWAAATDNRGVARYDVYRSTTPGFTPAAANKVGQSPTTGYTDTGLPAGTYYYRVIAVDAVGNASAPSPEASAVVTADVTAPTVALTAPADGATVSGVISVTASASDDVGVVGVQFLLNGQALGAEDTTAPYSVSWDTSGKPNGTYTLTAVARDAAGHSTTSAPVAVTVSNAAPTNLVGAWGFEEGSGTTTADASGHTLTGTLSNATWVTGGKYGKALSFNGTNAWVTVADNALLHLTSGMTVEAWVMPTAASTDWTAAVLKERGTNGLAYGLYATDGAGKPPAGYINRNGTDVEAAGTSVLPLNVWSYLTVTYDGATIRLYVNGAQVATKAQTGSISSSTAPLRIGGDSIWGEYFKGLIDEVRVYNVARTAAQVQADMNAPVGGPQLAAEGAAPAGSAPALTAAQLAPVAAEAVRRWQAAGLTPAQAAALRSVQFRIVDLGATPVLALTPTGGSVVTLDDDGAGRGWFADPTPADDAEFAAAVAPAEARAPGGPAAGRYDLLTVVMHELGHVLGQDDLDPAAAPHDLLTATLPLGTRRLPAPERPGTQVGAVNVPHGTRLSVPSGRRR